MKKDKFIEFADWINNNWYEPIGYDGMWRLRVEDIEYILEIPEVNLFTTEELYEKWSNGEGES